MVEQQLKRRGITSPAVLEAMRKVPRHCFVEEALQESAYNDYPIPVGEGQTISQPYMVALMTEMLDVAPTHTVLEVGTGSGYQTAVLAEMAQQVYTIERLPKLAQNARAVLERLKYYNVQVKVGDGTLGWKEDAPYDRIIVTAGAPAVPEALKDQLKVGGKLVAPVGSRYSQVLNVVTKHENNRLEVEKTCPCVFVKLVGEHGWTA